MKYSEIIIAGVNKYCLNNKIDIKDSNIMLVSKIDTG